MLPLHDTGFAKLNLALHVRNRQADGYHELETLFAFCDGGDGLSATASDNISLEITGPFAAGLSAGEDNLVVRAAQALRTDYGIRSGVKFSLDKRLPVASGIGGGSADAAAALRLCARLWEIELDALRLEAIAATLGADVPACVSSQTCFGTGVGEQLEPIAIAGLTGSPVLLVNPMIACPTGPVFKAWDGVDRGALDPLNWQNGHNDLQPPATSLVPEIAAVLALLAAQPDAVATRMSGSGATCFALFHTLQGRDAAALAFAKSHPDYWVFPTTIR